MARIELVSLSKSFGAVEAVKNLSLAIEDGEFVVLVGPSGCGKTTTLRCVAGLEHPTDGEISIAGRVVSSPARGILVPPRSRDLGMVFQSYAVWPHMTVRQNVIYPLKHRRIARTEASRKVDEVLELVGLSEYADRPVVALSGGQMQRVALARSIVYRPQLLLLDEPLSNLDAKLRLRWRQHIPGARSRSPLPGNADRLRHRSVRPAAGSARARHGGPPSGRGRDVGFPAARRLLGVS